MTLNLWSLLDYHSCERVLEQHSLPSLGHRLISCLSVAKVKRKLRYEGDGRLSQMFPDSWRWFWCCNDGHLTTKKSHLRSSALRQSNFATCSSSVCHQETVTTVCFKGSNFAAWSSSECQNLPMGSSISKVSSKTESGHSGGVIDRQPSVQREASLKLCPVLVDHYF